MVDVDSKELNLSWSLSRWKFKSH